MVSRETNLSRGRLGTHLVVLTLKRSLAETELVKLTIKYGRTDEMVATRHDTFLMCVCVRGGSHSGNDSLDLDPMSSEG